MDHQIFCGKLLESCKKSRDHAFAYWKMNALAREGQAYCLKEYDSYYAVYRNFLFAYLSSDGQCHIPIDTLNRFDCIQMNADLYDTVKDQLVGFTPYYWYKLHYDFFYEPPSEQTHHYLIVDFDFTNEQHFVEASNMINQGNGNWMMPENIKKIMREPVFDPSLWFFIKDTSGGEQIGICISTYDSQLHETDIEWMYILPAHQGRGAGRFLINETIRRSKGRSEDIRVGGTNEFYKKCGFVEKSRTVWASKKGYSLIAPCIQPNLLP